jgi:hypothetical protein
MKFIRTILAKIASLFTPAGQKKVQVAMATAYDVMLQALPIVELIASLTPTRADDEIVAMIRKYALPIPLPEGPLSDLDKQNYLANAAFLLVKEQVKAAGVPDNVIDLGVQMAYTAWKAAR